MVVHGSPEGDSPVTCPHCGSEVPDGAANCKECGSDADTGWARHADHYGLLSEESIEPPRSTGRVAKGAVALVVVAAFAAFFVAGGTALLVAFGVCAIAFVAVQLWRRNPIARRSAALRELLALTRGDPGLAERLIAFELERRPGLTREQAIRSASARLEQDRR